MSVGKERGESREAREAGSTRGAGAAGRSSGFLVG